MTIITLVFFQPYLFPKRGAWASRGPRDGKAHPNARCVARKKKKGEEVPAEELEPCASVSL